jgi:tRNA(adenine34) deaminase
VTNVLGDARLNHQTTVTPDVLADECGALLRDFFRPRRVNPSPLREDALRTPDAAFTDLPDWPWPPRYVADLPALAGLRMHLIDTGPDDAPVTWLLLHDSAAWGLQFRHLIPTLAAAGHRVVVPDLIGFGRSDKPKRQAAHDLIWHLRTLRELMDRLDLRRVILAGHGLGERLALTLPVSGSPGPERYRGLLLIDARDDGAAHPEQLAGPAYAAPFPNAGYRAALRAVPRLWRESETLLDDANCFWRTAPRVLTETCDLSSPAQTRALIEKALRYFAPGIPS